MNTLHVQDEWDEHSAEHRLAGQQDGLREDGPDPGAFPDAEDDPEEELSGFEGMSDEDIALLAQRGDTRTAIYSDSRTGMAWVRDRKCKSKLAPNAKNAALMQIVRRAEAWLQGNTISNRIIKWNTEEWGEIPADFGRK